MADAFNPPAVGGFIFHGKIALVTGAGRGVGAAVAQALHAGGACVGVSDVDVDAAVEVARSLDATGATAIGLRLDVRRKEQFEAVRDTLVKQWGKIDIVVNNAGYAKRTPTADIGPEEFDEIVAINMRSVFLSCQIFSEHMKSNGYGRIVNITSLAGQNGGTVASPHYAAAKAGAIMLTKYFARYTAGEGITVNAIAPGPIETAKGRLSDAQIARVEGEIPVGRFMEVSEIAAAVCLLASDQGGFFVGATLDMNGGLYLR